MILGLIPARGGSKGILQKNIKKISGTPLIDFTVNAAKISKYLDDFIVSTDCNDILEHVKNLNVQSNGLRPPHLATDTAKTIDTVIYELLEYEKNHKVHVDNIVLLQPTAPLRTAEDIDLAIAEYNLKKQPSLISCYNAESTHPKIMYNVNDGLLRPFLKNGNEPQRRQDMETMYIRNGAIYIANREEVLIKNRLISDTPSLYEMPRSRSINIDNQEDVIYAEYFLNRQERNEN